MCKGCIYGAINEAPSTRPMVLKEVQQGGFNSNPFLTSHQSQRVNRLHMSLWLVHVCKVSPRPPLFQLEGSSLSFGAFYTCMRLEFEMWRRSMLELIFGDFFATDVVRLLCPCSRRFLQAGQLLL